MIKLSWPLNRAFITFVMNMGFQARNPGLLVKKRLVSGRGRRGMGEEWASGWRDRLTDHLSANLQNEEFMIQFQKTILRGGYTFRTSDFQPPTGDL